MSRRYGPVRIRGGNVVQGGIGLRNRFDPLSSLEPRNGPYRAIVVNTRVLEEEGATRNHAVECDVIVVVSQTPLKSVPVEQSSHGVNNVQDLWIPRPTSRLVSDESASVDLLGQITRRGTFIGSVSRFDDLDGDMVLIDFIEHNHDWPIIRGALSHERSKRLIVEGEGWAEGEAEAKRGRPEKQEAYTRHQGTEVRVNAQGDYLIDTVGAHSGTVDEDPETGAGDVRVRVKDGQRLTIAMGDDEDVFEVWKDGDQVRIDLGEGATERNILGDSFMQFLNNWFSEKFDNHQHEPGDYATSQGPVKGNSGPPSGPGSTVPTTKYTGTTMGEDLLSDLAKTKKS